MIVKMIGTGAILATRFSASALIDDKILIDVPNGAMKQIRRLGNKPENIDVVLLTHFHGDHYFDMPFLLFEQGLIRKREAPLHVVAPRGESYKIKDLFLRGYEEETYEKLAQNTMLNIIEIDRDEEIELEGYKIKAVKVEHTDSLKTLGYIIRKDGKSFGYTGDARLCDGIIAILNKTEKTVMDVSFIQKHDMHVGLEEAEELGAKYKEKCEIIATHMCDDVRSQEVKYIKIADDGDVFEV
ncbi:MAG: hypothetical protein A2Y24_05970 [Clostridiales bacterium GWE2_32_10]|nr:MAG: hypothetical protein A2Y24_05970 [Clostridiales bacterium GWE2_32_10]